MSIFLWLPLVATLLLVVVFLLLLWDVLDQRDRRVTQKKKSATAAWLLQSRRIVFFAGAVQSTTALVLPFMTSSRDLCRAWAKGSSGLFVIFSGTMYIFFYARLQSARGGLREESERRKCLYDLVKIGIIGVFFFFVVILIFIEGHVWELENKTRVCLVVVVHVFPLSLTMAVADTTLSLLLLYLFIDQIRDLPSFGTETYKRMAKRNLIGCLFGQTSTLVSMAAYLVGGVLDSNVMKMFCPVIGILSVMCNCLGAWHIFGSRKGSGSDEKNNKTGAKGNDQHCKVPMRLSVSPASIELSTLKSSMDSKGSSLNTPIIHSKGALDESSSICEVSGHEDPMEKGPEEIQSRDQTLSIVIFPTPTTTSTTNTPTSTTLTPTTLTTTTTTTTTVVTAAAATTKEIAPTPATSTKEKCAVTSEDDDSSYPYSSTSASSTDIMDT
eukprot:gb/GEZN01005523.1/.p1 GENE.gb/GEZN01005523.1/~~gb/GEZN01005523.1/.p1  ORF type:complete len:440 (-),score=58.80 gb/GEZN01005523.1/:346-1665(-)